MQQRKSPRKTILKQKMRIKQTFGIIPESSLMFPCTPECSETVVCKHHVGVVVYSVKYNASERSRKPWDKDVALALSAGCHDLCVVVCKGKECDATA